ncbi:ankyrin repeat domain-containing protein [Spirochaetia bacterium 38H-sp]|uniref:Ankyrin repeat domain-containing protein n=1 Tax=Rarispira pelagica TaxID=3141764 RepID=A0ABU9U8M7_9SPIR
MSFLTECYYRLASLSPEGQIEELKKLQKVTYPDRLLEKIFMTAITKENIQLIKTLLEMGIYKNFKDYNYYRESDPPIEKAIEIGNLDIVKMLIPYGANIHAALGYTIVKAVLAQSVEIVKFLLDNGADVHAFKDAALIFAVEKNYHQIVDVLLQYGADVHARNEEPLLTAISNYHFDLADFLIQKGADVNVLSTIHEYLGDAVYFIRKDFQMARYIKSKNIDIFNILVLIKDQYPKYVSEFVKSLDIDQKTVLKALFTLP